MGTYETPTEPLVITLDGSKHYDGNTTSNSCAWTWTRGDTNGADKIGWVTLCDDEGKWKTDGKGSLNSGELCNVPGVGDQPFSGFVTSGAWNQSFGTVIDRDTFPIFLFGYGSEDPSVDSDRPDKPFLMAAAPKSSLAVSPLQNALAITDFAVDGPDAVSGEALLRFGGDDLEVSGRTVRGCIEHGDWGFRLSLGYEF